MRGAPLAKADPGHVSSRRLQSAPSERNDTCPFECELTARPPGAGRRLAIGTAAEPWIASPARPRFDVPTVASCSAVNQRRESRVPMAAMTSGGRVGRKKKRAGRRGNFDLELTGIQAERDATTAFCVYGNSSVFPSQQLKVWCHRAADLLFMLQLISFNRRRDEPTAERRWKGVRDSCGVVQSVLGNSKNFELIILSWMLDFEYFSWC